MAKRNLTYDLIALIQSGEFRIVQQQNGGPEEPYAGCYNNLFMWLDSGEAKVSLREPSDPQARKGRKTYKVEIDTIMGDFVFTIWEREGYSEY